METETGSYRRISKAIKKPKRKKKEEIQTTKKKDGKLRRNGRIRGEQRYLYECKN